MSTLVTFCSGSSGRGRPMEVSTSWLKTVALCELEERLAAEDLDKLEAWRRNGNGKEEWSARGGLLNAVGVEQFLVTTTWECCGREMKGCKAQAVSDHTICYTAGFNSGLLCLRLDDITLVLLLLFEKVHFLPLTYAIVLFILLCKVRF